MKRLNSLEDLVGVHRVLRDQRLEKERLAREQAELAAKREKEANLFRHNVRDVTPLPDANRYIAPPEAPLPVPKQRLADEEAALQESLSDEMDVERFLETDDKLSYRRNGVGLEALRKLRKGQWVVRAQVDLHGYRTDEARQAVAEFIRNCVRHDVRCVRIIHGKGLGSAGKEPVLKDKVKRWLVQKDEVLAFCQAPPRDGGAGALLVILKAKQQ